MGEQGIKSFTLEQLQEMHHRGETRPTRPDAPEFNGDDEFWASAEQAILGEQSQSSVVLKLDRKTIDRFREAGPDYLERMAHVLEEYARKAS